MWNLSVILKGSVEYPHAETKMVFNIGVDTIGGIRIPAAFCGILGYSASHGLMSMVGVTRVAPSLDVVGNYHRPCISTNKVYVKLAFHIFSSCLSNTYVVTFSRQSCETITLFLLH